MLFTESLRCLCKKHAYDLITWTARLLYNVTTKCLLPDKSIDTAAAIDTIHIYIHSVLYLSVLFFRLPF